MRFDVFAMVFMYFCLCVSVLVSCTSPKTPSKPSTVTSVSLQTGKREIRTQRSRIPLFVAFNTYYIVPLTLSVSVWSLHLFQRDRQECFILNICVCLCSFDCLLLCVFWAWLHVCGFCIPFGFHLSLTHALTHPHPYTTTDKHTHTKTETKIKTLFVPCLCCLCCPQRKQVSHHRETEPQ